MCSAEELGLPKGEDGLLILPADAPLGQKLAEYLGGGDAVYDIEVDDDGYFAVINDEAYDVRWGTPLL